jgi:hypothetical protein
MFAVASNIKTRIGIDVMIMYAVAHHSTPRAKLHCIVPL